MASHSGVSLHLSELRIVMLGYKDGGKSSSGNTILAREEFKLGTTAQCVKRHGKVAGRKITVVDTPGWFRNFCLNDTTELVKQEIVCSVSLCPPGPHAFLLVIRVDLAITETFRESVEGHLGLLNPRDWDHTIVLFTYGDGLGDTTIEQHIEREGEALQRLAEKCGNRYHVFNNENRGDVTELLEKIEEMVAGNRGGHYEIGAPSTPLPTSFKRKSRETPPCISEDDISGRRSTRSSGYGSQCTLSSASESLTSSLSSGVDALYSDESLVNIFNQMSNRRTFSYPQASRWTPSTAPKTLRIVRSMELSPSMSKDEHLLKMSPRSSVSSSRGSSVY